ncbi:sialidase family protein [Ruania alba]|uniref:Predicted neuraminidase (Sialidase) n=1 Tax=Ruania alba TaxID=648782 RepID=A0A1H5LE37_9MICO|nr:sialidase family protein [Ruania alba]SEE75322.1 Predicted neuraminidase (sialidase) [Ruania alba]
MDKRFDGRLRRSTTDPELTEALLPVLHPVDSHAATLVETSAGDLLCAWFNGPQEGDRETNVVLSRLPAGTAQWEQPRLMAADPDRSEQNPVLFRAPEGRIWLLHTSNTPHHRTDAHVLARVSDDDGATWSEPETLFTGPGFFLRNPPLFLPDGTWLLPAYQVDSDGEYSVVALSADDGRSWEVREVPGSRHRVQMSIAPRSDGSLLGLFRSRAADRVYASESTDLGRTWTAPVRTTLPNNNSAVHQIALADGRLAAVYNDATMERDQFRFVPSGDSWRKKAVRTPLTLALSDDGGRTWPAHRNLQVADLEYKDAPAGYSYPTMIQTSDGALQIAYSYLRKTIKHVRLQPEWIARQTEAGLALDTTEDAT